MSSSEAAATPEVDAPKPVRGLARARSWSPGSLLALDTATATRVYWAGVFLVALAFFVPRLLPCVDYPQHLALADIARRLQDPAAPEHASHQINYFTYNGLFHVVVGKLSRWMPIEVAGRLIVASSTLMLGGAALALLRVLGRPPAYAALFTPALFSFALGWGFVNYALGSAIGFTTAVFVARALQRPGIVPFVATAVLGLLCAMTHVLAMLLLCLFAASLAPELALRATWPEGRPRLEPRAIFRLVLRIVVALAPLLVGAVWCIAVYQEQYEWDPAMYADATLEGTSPPLWEKLLFFGSFVTGAHADRTDQITVLASIAVVVAAVVIRLRRGRATGDPDRPLILPFVMLFSAYLATPMVFIGTHLIFPRLAQAVLLAAILAAPRIDLAPIGPRLRAAALAIGLFAGVNLVVHAAIYAWETDDLSRVIDDLPSGRRATAVVHGAETFSFRHGTLVHAAAYYAARKAGDWSFSFARYLSVPVRFKPGGGPPWPKLGWEFEPSDYNPRCQYARHFDLVIVKAPRGLPKDASAESAVRAAVFRDDAAAPKLLSQHGAYWAFDTRGLPSDGTF